MKRALLMKKAGRISIFVVGLLFALSFIYPRIGHAVQTTKTMSASVTVNSVFNVTATPPSLNFGNIDQIPCTTAIKDLYLHISTNHNNPWSVTIKALSPLTSGMFTIPNENFNYWGWGGSRTWDLGPGHLEATPLSPFYTASSEEYMTSYVGLTLQFNVDIPEGQAAGLYATSIVVTMEDQETHEKVEQTVYVTVGINSNFSISAEPSSLIFSHTDPGATTERKNLYVACFTNNNNLWSVSIKVVSELTFANYTVPNENFHWLQEGSLSGTGTWDAGTGYLDTIPHTFYEAGAGEWITTSPVELTLQFYVDVPVNQVAGTYTTTLILTMAE